MEKESSLCSFLLGAGGWGVKNGRVTGKQVRSRQTEFLFLEHTLSELGLRREREGRREESSDVPSYWGQVDGELKTGELQESMRTPKN